MREVEAAPDEHIDLWSREHYKSTIITWALTIQDVLRSHGEDPIDQPEAVVGIFSHTRPIAKSFLRQIKREFEGNVALKKLFPDVLFENPRAQAPLWSEDSGIVVKRRSNPKESTVEAWGLVDGQPTSKHFSHMIYDDVVTRESVTSSEMIAKTTEAWELSTNLESGHCRRRIIGTRYRMADTYEVLIERKIAKVRLHPATHDGTLKGDPVFWSRELWDKKARDMGPKTAACQLLQNPKEGSDSQFKREFLQWHSIEGTGGGLNKYILVDPANRKRKKSDRTAMWVIGLGADRNYYVLDCIRDRLNLEERANILLDLHAQYRPLKVGYEEYGMQADIEHIQYRQKEITYNFEITPLKGALSKEDRIDKLYPILEDQRLYLPQRGITRKTYDGHVRDVIQDWLYEEYDLWPVPRYDDGLDALARILDPALEVRWPKGPPPKSRQQKDRERYAKKQQTKTWRSM